MKAFNLIANQHILYPKNTEVWIEKIIPNEFSTNFKFKSDYKIYIEGKELNKNILTILYPQTSENKRIELKANNSDYFIDLSIVPEKCYKESNNFDPGQFIINKTDIPFYTGITLESFIRSIPGSIKDKINHEIPSDNPEQIAKTIIKNTENSKGTPSTNQINSNGFDQYINAKEGKDKVWCANLSDIFVYFLHAKGIPARRINLWTGSIFDNETTLKTKYWFIPAPGHTVVEYYSNGWKLADLTLNTYEFTFEEKSLNLIQFKNLIEMGFEDKIICKTNEENQKLTEIQNHQHTSNSYNNYQIYTTFTYN